ncbi:unnamed protein product [Phytophthora lilii]|uniref:Unnamed protein product n=1 Tax=Phytophthora lilii TaxID=2077276 RepID=A0A9W6TCU0_9STRA|nr:unnamed protein product [Phytophthora lilii]
MLEASAVFTNRVGRLKMARDALQRKRDEASKLKATNRREEYEQQLNKEEKELDRQAALLKHENSSAYQQLMKELQITKTPTYEQDKKMKAKKTKAKAKAKTKANQEKKQRPKRKADGAVDQGRQKKKGPVVDTSVYVPPNSTADEIPARVIPTRSRARSQPETAEVKNEVKTELPKVELKTETE